MPTGWREDAVAAWGTKFRARQAFAENVETNNCFNWKKACKMRQTLFTLGLGASIWVRVPRLLQICPIFPRLFALRRTSSSSSFVFSVSFMVLFIFVRREVSAQRTRDAWVATGNVFPISLVLVTSNNGKMFQGIGKLLSLF